MTGGERVGRPADPRIIAGDLSPEEKKAWNGAWDWRAYALKQEERADQAERELSGAQGEIESLYEEIAWSDGR